MSISFNTNREIKVRCCIELFKFIVSNINIYYDEKITDVLNPVQQQKIQYLKSSMILAINVFLEEKTKFKTETLYTKRLEELFNKLKWDNVPFSENNLIKSTDVRLKFLTLLILDLENIVIYCKDTNKRAKIILAIDYSLSHRYELFPFLPKNELQLYTTFNCSFY